MKVTIQPYGDRALLVQWQQIIDPGINAEVVQLSQAISKAAMGGVQYCIPAYCSLTVGFDPKLVKYEELCDQIRSLQPQRGTERPQEAVSRQITIPVCYDDDFAPDLEWLSQYFGLEKEQIIQLHTHSVFRVYMLGFMPGFPYMGSLPKALETPRKDSPRLRVPAGSVGLAGLQTGIYPIESPGGWQIIGRTPIKIFDPEREQPFYLQAGDEVRFEAIDLEAYHAFKK